MRNEKVKINEFEFVIEDNISYKNFGQKMIDVFKELFDKMNVGDSVFIPENKFKPNSVSCYVNTLRKDYYKDTVVFKRRVIKDDSDKILGCRIFRIN